ncbi:sensor histidine kinase KdpD [uncultured Phenylobacterium sp.]|uniref:sensor histidine kinase n=1 Tax=uncultured Phenylobacterium sp. TaxID=349273 RepID=UPI0025D1A2FE|nr:HAMP domain-containing sensor histidine kinase [uncultured Phenylobacterium sp.]
MAFWAVMVALSLVAKPQSEAEFRTWAPVVYVLAGAYIAGLTSVVWVLMPYAPYDLRLVVALFLFGLVVNLILNKPEGINFIRPAIICVTGSLAAFFALHPGPWSSAVVLFCLLFGGTLVALSGVFPTAMSEAFNARQVAVQALADAQTARAATTRFLASASHDLGQPLNSARLYFDRLMGSTSGRDRLKAAQGVEGAFEAIGQMIDQVTNYLRLDAGALASREAAVQLGQVIAQTVEQHEPAARTARVVLRTLSNRLVVAGDPILVERVLGNLIHNAIRHAQARTILVGAKRHGSMVRLWVIDDGVGILPADQATIFDPYVQGSDHAGEIRGGYGLGLASARLMADLMGGRVGYDPRWRNGSAFFLELSAC